MGAPGRGRILAAGYSVMRVIIVFSISPLFENSLLQKLSEDDLELLGQMRRVELAPQSSLEIADQPVDFVYFIERGFASVVSEWRGDVTEIGIIGREGMTGLSVIHGADTTPFSTFLQGEGAAIRVDADELRRALGESASLNTLLMRYAQAYAVQLASTASANGQLLLEQRLARWLLMVADRTGNSFPITHESLAIMLSVRRPGVTRALQDLQARGLIGTVRGAIAIVDRDGLIEYSPGQLWPRRAGIRNAGERAGGRTRCRSGLLTPSAPARQHQRSIARRPRRCAMTARCSG